MSDAPIKRGPSDLAHLRASLRAVTPDATVSAERTLTAVRVAVALRRRRARVFGPVNELFSDPTWDALLTLFVADAEGRSISIPALTAAMRVSSSTAERWIRVMETRGLVLVTGPERDPQRRRIRLTPSTRDGMRRVFEPFT